VTTLATDDFHRQDGALTSPWTIVTGNPTNFQITTNIANVSSLTADDAYYFNTVPPIGDQWAQCTLNAPSNSAATHGYGVTVRCSTSANTYYRLTGNRVGYELYKQVAAAPTTLSTAASPVFNTGDVIRLEVIGTTLICYRNGISFFSISDAGIATGVPGIGFSSTETVSAGNGISLWSAGDFSPTTLLMGAALT
jgi:hypothetical protein